LEEDYLVNPQVTVFIEEYSTVSIMGEVKRPGAYPIKGRLTVAELISLAEGFTDIAGPNKVKVLRTNLNGDKEEILVRVNDLMNKEAGGNKENVVLQSGDIVVVPEERNTVSIVGEVQRPGSFTIKGDLTIVELISLAGGFTDIASPNRVKVLRTNPDDQKEEMIVKINDLMNKESGNKENIILQSGDIIVVPEERNTVSIMGEVKKPGSYPIKGDLTIVELISLAEGFTDIAASNRVKIIHVNPQGLKEETTVKVYDLMNNKGSGEQDNVILRSGDIVVVPEERNTVSIMGEVKKPGSYPIKGDLTIVELISLAEGFTDIAAPNKVKVIHTNADGVKEEKVVMVNDLMNKESGEKDNVVLQPGDIVVVPQERNTVSIVGEVRKPGSYPIKGQLTVIELISMAEGFTKIASPNKVKVIRTGPDGIKEEIAVKVHDIMNNKGSNDQENIVLKVGDIVVVPESMF